MAARTTARVLTYGFAADADVGAESRRVRPAPTGCASRSSAGRPASRPTHPGARAARVHNALARPRSAWPPGSSSDEIAAGLRGGWSAPHRGELIRAGRRHASSTTRTTRPRARCVAALDLLASLPGRRVAVLGEMLELGEGNEAGHRAVGEAAAAHVDRLVVVGEDGAAAIVDGAATPGSTRPASSSAPTARRRSRLRPRLREGDVVLVKASRGVELDLLRRRPARPTLGPARRDGRAHPGPAARVRARRDPDAAVHPPAASSGFGKQIRVEGPQSHIVKEGTPTMGGLLIIVVVGGVSLFLGASRRRDLRAAGDARQRRPAGRGRRLPEREDRRGDQRPPEAALADVVAIVAAYQIQNTYDINAIRVPFVGDVVIGPRSTSSSPRSRSSPPATA